MDDIDRRIINGLQGGFPIVERPFAVLSEQFGLDEDDLITRIDRLCAEGFLSRFGPMYDADRLGGGTCLAAMAVPEDRFEAVTAQVNAHPEIAHNYARAHALNMWFVVAAEASERIEFVLGEIAAETGLAVYAMPKLEEYFVCARFDA
jgi:DNA-binding Lrp family transcriptional regulator